jgi:NAD(P)-dependent dehydrogenase (short-subunit alcohol dehydrogenase family)
MLLSPVSEATTDDWRRMIQINLLGTMYMTKAALPLIQPPCPPNRAESGEGSNSVDLVSIGSMRRRRDAGAHAPALAAKGKLAREQRASPTTGEVRLWRELRRRALDGWRFRRQHVIGGFIVHFYCPTVGSSSLSRWKGLAKKVLKSKGQKRSTTYSAA